MEPSAYDRLFRFCFRSVWRLPAPVAEVYAVLERAEEYPLWWPQVREVHWVDEGSGTARIRSVLPYDLLITGTAVRRAVEAGVLEMRISGDMAGWARWTVTRRDTAAGPGAVAVYEQQVEVGKPLLRLLAVPGRPVLRSNHALMMRAGERGLRQWLGRGLDEG